MLSSTYDDNVRTSETSLTLFSQSLRSNAQYSSLVQVIGGTLGEFRTLAGNDLSITVYENEPTVYLGDLYGDNEVSFRLQSLLRESQYTINALRGNLIEVGKAQSNIKFEDQSRTFEFLRIELAKASEELSRLRNNVPANLTPLVPSNASGDVRALQARNQDLEGQLRNIKLEYENKIRELNTQIEALRSENRTLTVRLEKGTTSTHFGSPNYQQDSIELTPGRAGYTYNQTSTPSSSTSSQNIGSYNRPTNVPQSGTAVRTQQTTSSVTSSNLTNSGSFEGRTGQHIPIQRHHFRNYLWSHRNHGLSGSRTRIQATTSSITESSNLISSGSFRVAGTTTYGATGTGLSGSRTGATSSSSYTSGNLGGSRTGGQGSGSYNFRNN